MNIFVRFLQPTEVTKNGGSYWIAPALLLMLLFVPAAFGQTIIFKEDWSGGIGNWNVSNGLWQVDTLVPGFGPDTCYSPPKCAGTLLGANYPHGSNTSLQSPIAPAISLPSINSSERIQLKFWHWFRNSNDNGTVEISVNNGTWVPIPTPVSAPAFTGSSPVWTQYIADLSSYADSTIRIGFHFTSGSTGSDHGWYIDNICIEKDTVIFGAYVEVPATNDSIVFENFENGVNSWSADNGLWEVGKPSAGPDSCYSSPYCAGTILSGNYPHGKQARFISPGITLKPKCNPDSVIIQRPVLFFWHWFNLVDDNGFVQISVNDGPWQDPPNNRFTGASPGWTQAGGYDLSSYVNLPIRIGFFFTSNSTGSSTGWYIDDIRITNLENPLEVEALLTHPMGFALHQNFPNPFNPKTVILYELPQTSQVEVAIFNLLGERIRTLVNQRQTAGQHRLHWDGRNEFGMPVPSGAYLYRLRAGEFVQTRKMVLMQ